MDDKKKNNKPHNPDRPRAKVIPRVIEKPEAKQKEGSAKAKKTSARLAAVQVLYQMRLNNQDAPSTINEYVNHRSGFNLDGDVLVPPDAEMLEKIVLGVQNRWTDIEAIMNAALAEGRKSEVEVLLECILRAGIYEMMEHAAIDKGIIINDYLNVTSSFYEGSESKLVNAILDKAAKAVRS